MLMFLCFVFVVVIVGDFGLHCPCPPGLQPLRHCIFVIAVVVIFVVIVDVDVVVVVDDDVGLHALCPPSYGALPSWQQDLSASHNISINISTQYL